MNTTARIESSGRPGCIHVSQQTADLIIAAGKHRWLVKREDVIVAKGKGSLQTYWLSSNGPSTDQGNGSFNQGLSVDGEQRTTELELPGETDLKTGTRLSEKRARLVGWNSDLLLRHLKQVVAHRESRGSCKIDSELSFGVNSKPFEEVVDVLELPSDVANNVDSVELDEAVGLELQQDVVAIASMYRNHAFHNFEHASHVAMSVAKLLSRVVAPSSVELNRFGAVDTASALHDYTYGITSDPLTQFCCIFSALIHDVDHPGIPNSVMIAENSVLLRIPSWLITTPRRALRSRIQLVSDFLSLNNTHLFVTVDSCVRTRSDLAWNLLYTPDFKNLRQAIMPTQEEQRRFR